MRNLHESIEGITEHYIELCKNVDRLFRINIDMLKKDSFDRGLYGEAKLVEDIINAFDVKVKETSIMAIARFQPAASDLRSLITFIESSKMLERMGDLLLDSLVLMRKIEKKEGNMERDFGILENFLVKINDIFQKYLEAFIEKDEKKAYVLLGMDEEINEIRGEIDGIIVEQMKEDSKNIEAGVLMLLINKKYERVSDKITQLTMSSIYNFSGENMRVVELLEKEKHKSEEDEDEEA